jgi:hypothetical protein
LATYDLAFAKKFAEVAHATIASGPNDVETHRVVAYISRLSMELSLKAFLEHAGMPLQRIRNHSHNLRALAVEASQCEVRSEISPDTREWVPAARFRALPVPLIEGQQATVGMILDAEAHGASKYPSELRYGEQPKDFPADVIAKAALRLAEWIESHWTEVRSS